MNNEARVVFACIVARAEKFSPASRTVIHSEEQLKFMFGNIVEYRNTHTDKHKLTHTHTKYASVLLMLAGSDPLSALKPAPGLAADTEIIVKMHQH